MVIGVGGELGENAWYISASLSARFGPLGMSASGFIASWGSFSFTLSGYVDLTFAGTGIEGTLIGARVVLRTGRTTTSSRRTCLDDVGPNLLTGLTQSQKNPHRRIPTPCAPIAR